jgi:hypothetical protein
MEFKKVFYNGLETNVEVTECGRVRRITVDWMKKKYKIGDVDFSKLKLSHDGYQSISIKIKGLNNRTILAHQLIASAFLDYKFQGNKLVIDHIDSDKLNNKLNNLRVITNRENSSKEKTIKRCFPVGVYFHKKTKKYKSEIKINKKTIYLGLYLTPEQASIAYQNKLKSL